MKELLDQLTKLRFSIYLRQTKDLFWRTSTIITRTNPCLLEVRTLPENLLYPFAMEAQSYNPGDVVYLKYSPDRTSNESWPALGTSYEIDCKVIECIDSTSKNVAKHVYSIITGHGRFTNASGASMIHPKHKELYQNLPVYVCAIDTELCPKDTLFAVKGDYACNDMYGVYISVNRLSELITQGVFSIAKTS